MESFPACVTCPRQFSLKGPIPYLLPCLHSACETCVTSATGGVISCNLCHRDFDLSRTTLRKDIIRQREVFQLTVKYRPTELLCANDDGNQAVCWCPECEEMFCEHCQNMHEKFKATRQHKVDKLGESMTQLSDCDQFCEEHTRSLLYLYDSDCDQLICAQCKFEKHAEHTVQKISEAYDSTKQSVSSFLESLLKVQERAKQSRDGILRQIETADEVDGNVKAAAELTFSSVKTMISQREKEVLIDLDRATHSCKGDLSSQRAGFDKVLQEVATPVDYLEKTLLYASLSDLLTLKSFLGQTTQSCLDAAENIKEERVPTVMMSKSGLPRLKSQISQFSRITMELDKSRLDDSLTTEVSAQTDETHATWTETLKDLENLRQSDKEKTEEMKTLRKDLGRLKQSDKEKTEEMKMLCRQLNSPLIAVTPTEQRTTIYIICQDIQFCRKMLNSETVHINTEGELVTRKDDDVKQNNAGSSFTNYWGTCSSVSLPRAGCAQYWEVITRVGIKTPLVENTIILEIGLCWEEERDVHLCIAGRPHSYVMTVSQCPSHSGICRCVWKEGRTVSHTPNTLPNTADTSASLHYGIVYDASREKVVFIDVSEKKVLQVLDNVDSSQPLWPMFAVYNTHLLTANMTLVVGKDIELTEEKKTLIVQSLIS